MKLRYEFRKKESQVFELTRKFALQVLEGRPTLPPRIATITQVRKNFPGYSLIHQTQAHSYPTEDGTTLPRQFRMGKHTTITQNCDPKTCYSSQTYGRVVDKKSCSTFHFPHFTRGCGVGCSAGHDEAGLLLQPSSLGDGAMPNQCPFMSVRAQKDEQHSPKDENSFTLTN